MKESIVLALGGGGGIHVAVHDIATSSYMERKGEEGEEGRGEGR